MPEDILTIVIVILVFSIFQSIFGVGLLVFGTPTCLLLGYSFEETISFLLPASISISCFQVARGKEYVHLGKNFAVFTIPFIAVGLFLVLSKAFSVDMNFIIGIMLLITAIIRSYERAKTIMRELLNKHINIYLAFMGFVHGISNMGGGLLTILSSSRFHTKKEILSNIAFGYIVFGTAQILVLLIYKPDVFTVNSFISPIISIFVYVTIGHTLFKKPNEATYQKWMTILILFYGVTLVII